MNIRIIGAGFYGCHIAKALIDAGHEVTVHEINGEIFGGASGKIPARIHLGFHYPRSKKTRNACLSHVKQFYSVYGKFCRDVETNIYAIAADQSMVDFEQYVDSLWAEVDFDIGDPEEYGLTNVEGMLLTEEKHIVTDDVKAHFMESIGDHIVFNSEPGIIDSTAFDLTIDATFCANESAGVDRYEPCVVALMKGPTDIAVTIMDGPFGSIYPWNEEKGLCSLSSAKWTPFSKQCKTYEEALRVLDQAEHNGQAEYHAKAMIDDMANYYPAIRNYEHVGNMFSIRAMPLSGADARLVDVVKVGERAIRIRAGKIDAVVQAEQIIKDMIK